MDRLGMNGSSGFRTERNNSLTGPKSNVHVWERKKLSRKKVALN